MEALLAHCQMAFTEHSSLLAVFFVGGLTAGFTHCLAMCGPLVVAESTRCAGSCGGCSTRQSSTRQVVNSASQWPYHLGRMATYGALGFAAALLSRQIQEVSWWPWLSAVMLIAAGLMFIGSSIPACRHLSLPMLPGNRFLKGALMGFIPCGMLYAALMMAATLADPFSGMVAMWLFVMGTLPALLCAGAGAQFLKKYWPRELQWAGRAVMAINGLSLLVMAENLVR